MEKEPKSEGSGKIPTFFNPSLSRLNLAAILSLFQPRGDRGASSPGSLQDPHCHIKTSHGGGQPEALVSGQQVSFET